jgi:predicted Zn-dependent protease
MKFSHYKLLLLLLSFLIISSCKSDDNEDIVNDPKAENLKELGTSAEDLLSDDIYNSLTVEFVYSNDFRPLQETLDSFRTFLTERINKPGGITFVETVITTPLESSYTISEIKDLEAEKRTKYTVGDKISVFVFFANANSSSDTNTSVTLGSAYLNTSIVVFEKTLRDLSSSQGNDLFILEATTLQHEFGHILGLVNLRNDGIHQNHEDPLHSSHCIVEECLMYFSSTNSRSLRNRSSVPELDPLCIEDLQAKGGK